MSKREATWQFERNESSRVPWRFVLRVGKRGAVQHAMSYESGYGWRMSVFRGSYDRPQDIVDDANELLDLNVPPIPAEELNTFYKAEGIIYP